MRSQFNGVQNHFQSEESVTRIYNTYLDQWDPVIPLIASAHALKYLRDNTQLFSRFISDSYFRVFSHKMSLYAQVPDDADETKEWTTPENLKDITKNWDGITKAFLNFYVDGVKDGDIDGNIYADELRNANRILSRCAYVLNMTAGMEENKNRLSRNMIFDPLYVSLLAEALFITKSELYKQKAETENRPEYKFIFSQNGRLLSRLADEICLFNQDLGRVPMVGTREAGQYRHCRFNNIFRNFRDVVRQWDILELDNSRIFHGKGHEVIFEKLKAQLNLSFEDVGKMTITPHTDNVMVGRFPQYHRR